MPVRRGKNKYRQKAITDYFRASQSSSATNVQSQLMLSSTSDDTSAMLDNPAADIIDRTISSSETEAGEHSKNEENISIDSASEGFNVDKGNDSTTSTQGLKHKAQITFAYRIQKIVELICSLLLALSDTSDGAAVAKKLLSYTQGELVTLVLDLFDTKVQALLGMPKIDPTLLARYLPRTVTTKGN
ncbi:predicted protein [Aspergillus terreus NIH2624]|uniref:Uncharacterized protein n=1 Tax=Aspergillus terreus (strain NIH 2624 / FGSC A1156) TaxID=341663 RepID=Q0CJ39_ASPTN|nr:uncharacterized protein ATEG_06295 [Aspergillus terreus NIH2624]EAU32839.1 predicted protein [Aspergillus terreus NIH2624]